MDINNGGQPKPSHVYLNYQGGKKQNCDQWNSKKKMDYTNFIDGVVLSNCNNKNMCIAVSFFCKKGKKFSDEIGDNRCR